MVPRFMRFIAEVPKVSPPFQLIPRTCKVTEHSRLRSFLGTEQASPQTKMSNQDILGVLGDIRGELGSLRREVGSLRREVGMVYRYLYIENWIP